MNNLDKLCEAMYEQKDGVMIELRLGNGLNLGKANEIKRTQQI